VTALEPVVALGPLTNIFLPISHLLAIRTLIDSIALQMSRVGLGYFSACQHYCLWAAGRASRPGQPAEDVDRKET